MTFRAFHTQAGKTCGSYATVVPIECELGSYCPEGSSAARPCSPGYFGNATGFSSADECLPCPLGASCGLGAKTWNLCSPGTFAANGSSPTCLPCPETTYQPGSGSTGCIVCGDGYHCPEGSSVRIPASCFEGTYLPSGTTYIVQADCKACPVASWCSGGRSAPKTCSAGSFGNISGLANCISCEAGRFQSKSNATACEQCKPGSYCEEGAPAALPCPTGRFSAETSLASAAECMPTSVGHYASTGTARSKRR